jgi:hypothetical protein
MARAGRKVLVLNGSVRFCGATYALPGYRFPLLTAGGASVVFCPSLLEGEPL